MCIDFNENIGYVKKNTAYAIKNIFVPTIKEFFDGFYRIGPSLAAEITHRTKKHLLYLIN